MAFARQDQLRVELAYYPPYHSKYNPIERCWGVLENYWNGSLLDSSRRSWARRVVPEAKLPWCVVETIYARE